MAVCDVEQNVLGRWILTNPYEPALAWTGTRWTRIDPRGFGIDVQVSNFATREEAEAYAWNAGFS